jgi:cytochrome b6-f complex iron-sulfur subunit
VTAFAVALVEAWVRLYTLGLPAEGRRARLDLIRADVADQVADAPAAGPVLAAALFGRCLRGMPADLTWRLYDAARGHRSPPVVHLEGRPIVLTDRTANLPFLAISAGIAWAAVLVPVIAPVPHSLAYAGGLLALIALAGWTLEARGTPDGAAAPSAWPLLLAVAIVAVAGGLIFNGGRLGLLLTVPLALGLSLALMRTLTALRDEALTADRRPIPAADLALHAAGGDAIAIERHATKGMTRRALLRGSFGLGLASAFAAMGGIMVDFLWQRNVAGFGGVVTAGLIGDFKPGTKTKVREGKFWLVNLTAEQGGPGFLALWQKCPHLGCVVPWEPHFRWPDPKTGERTNGWFRCPCHQSTYDHAGVRVYGPAPRSMDRMALRITADGAIEVDTGDISKGRDDNAIHAVRPEGS